MATPKALLRSDALSAYNFIVYFNYVTKVGFSKISSIERSVATEAFVEGGVNDGVHSLYTPLTEEKTIIFERGIILDSTHFTPAAMTVGVGQRLCENVIIAVLGPDRKARKVYSLDGCVFKKWVISDMDALSDQVLIERFEMVYERMEEC